MAAADPSWELYRSFLAVLGERSLSGAARRLGLSQPTLGRHIETLEQALGGLVLFTRSQQGFAPTEAALELEPHVRAMDAASAALVRAASGEAGEAKGVVRITASEIMGGEVLPSILTGFRAAHPAIDIELALSNRNEDLLHRESDIAVRMAQPTQGALLAARIGTVQILLHGAPDYLARHGVPSSLEDRAAHTIIGFDRTPARVGDDLRISVPVTRELFALRCDNDLAQLAAVKAGFGLGACQVPLGRRYGLKPVLTDMMSFSFGVWVVMHEDLKGVRRMRLMFDHLVEGLRVYLSS